jgi:hypothetical protein
LSTCVKELWTYVTWIHKYAVDPRLLVCRLCTSSINCETKNPIGYSFL